MPETQVDCGYGATERASNAAWISRDRCVRPRRIERETPQTRGNPE
ncbi:MAG: hypothetical protein JW828_07830 [Sedimentisphaerales bacterium]|nr:hypothetical protein [Sedimentisphaerales bacterium]